MNKSEISSRRFEGIHILYVDDEPDNLAAFELHFDEEFEVFIETDPIKALDTIKNDELLSILVVDQVMPGLSGLELATQAKKIRPTLTCIMITGNATKQLAIDSIRSQVFWEFLEKPVDFGANDTRQLLINAVQDHLMNKIRHDYREGTIELISRLIDDKDGHTKRHSSRVTEWAVKIAVKFDLSERETMMIREGALLHDIGKISIPDDILKKPGRLSALERKIIMTHPGRGGDLLDQVPQLKELSPMARYHHERPDGTGYPEGLKGEEIPLCAAIVALADFFEALSAKRPYKDPWELKDIVREIARVRGRQFPEECVDALFEILSEEGLIDSDEIQEITASIAA